MLARAWGEKWRFGQVAAWRRLSRRFGACEERLWVVASDGSLGGDKMACLMNLRSARVSVRAWAVEGKVLLYGHYRRPEFENQHRRAARPTEPLIHRHTTHFHPPRPPPLALCVSSSHAFHTKTPRRPHAAINCFSSCLCAGPPCLQLARCLCYCAAVACVSIPPALCSVCASQQQIVAK